MVKMLAIPGPVDVDEKVRRESLNEMINHRSREFSELLKKCVENLKKVFKTEGDVFILTASGTGAVEAMAQNIISKDLKVAVASNGYFGDRLIDIVSRLTKNFEVIRKEWGKPILANDIEKIDADVLFIVHNETSTGVENPIKEIAKVANEKDMLVCVDAVSSLGGTEFEMDAWNIGMAVSASQKCLACMPGLAFVAVNQNAWEIIEKAERRSYYFDLLLYKKFFSKGQTPFTPAVSLFYSLSKSLEKVLQEGIERRIEMHRKASEAIRLALREMNIELVVKEDKYASKTVTSAYIPDYIKERELLDNMRKQGIEIARGQGAFEGKIFRIGHLGDIDELKVLQIIVALYRVLSKRKRVSNPVDAILKILEK